MLGIIAGGGALPRAVAESAAESGRPVFVMAVEGSVDAGWVEKFPHAFAGVGEVGKALKALSGAGVKDVLFAGRVERPKFSSLKLDAKGMMVLPKVVAAARKGDDALLRTMLGIFEEGGFRSLSVAEAAPGLVAQPGALGKLAPNAEQQQDIDAGLRIVRAMGTLDVGQAAVVCDGLALAVEAAEGTDAMIARVGTLREALRGTPSHRRGVLVKALKPTQDAKTDMPVIGAETRSEEHTSELQSHSFISYALFCL